MIKTAKEVVATGDEKLLVDFAIESHRLITSTTKEFEAAKSYLRERAEDIVAHTNEPNATITGNIGTASIAFLKPEPRAKKEVDLLASEATMSPELWNLFFRKVTTVEVVGDAEAKMAALAPAQRNLIASLIEICPRTPRVTLK